MNVKIHVNAAFNNREIINLKIVQVFRAKNLSNKETSHLIVLNLQFNAKSAFP